MQFEGSTSATSPLPHNDEVPGSAGAGCTGAESTNAQLQAMQALTDTALSQLALDDLLREVVDSVTAGMGVDHVAILLVDVDCRTQTVRAARGLRGDGEDGER